MSGPSPELLYRNQHFIVNYTQIKKKIFLKIESYKTVSRKEEKKNRRTCLLARAPEGPHITGGESVRRVQTTSPASPEKQKRQETDIQKEVSSEGPAHVITEAEKSYNLLSVNRRTGKACGGVPV